MSRFHFLVPCPSGVWCFLASWTSSPYLSSCWSLVILMTVPEDLSHDRRGRSQLPVFMMFSFLTMDTAG